MVRPLCAHRLGDAGALVLRDGGAFVLGMMSAPLNAGSGGGRRMRSSSRWAENTSAGNTVMLMTAATKSDVVFINVCSALTTPSLATWRTKRMVRPLSLDDQKLEHTRETTA